MFFEGIQVYMVRIQEVVTFEMLFAETVYFMKMMQGAGATS